MTCTKSIPSLKSSLNKKFKCFFYLGIKFHLNFINFDPSIGPGTISDSSLIISSLISKIFFNFDKSNSDVGSSGYISS